jgi:hypothetical protein
MFGYQQALTVSLRPALSPAEHLAGLTRSTTDLASTLDADLVALSRLLRTPAALGIFTEVEAGRFGLTPWARRWSPTGPVPCVIWP